MQKRGLSMPCLNWRSQETLYTDVEIAAYAICVRTVMLSLHPEKFYVFNYKRAYRFLFQNVVSGLASTRPQRYEILWDLETA